MRVVYSAKYYDSVHSSDIEDLNDSYDDLSYIILEDTRNSLEDLKDLVDIETYTPLRSSFEILRIV